MLSTPEPRCTCCSMRSRSIGAVAVLLSAPARPPAQQVQLCTGCAPVRQLTVSSLAAQASQQRPETQDDDQLQALSNELT